MSWTHTPTPMNVAPPVLHPCIAPPYRIYLRNCCTYSVDLCVIGSIFWAEIPNTLKWLLWQPFVAVKNIFEIFYWTYLSNQETQETKEVSLSPDFNSSKMCHCVATTPPPPGGGTSRLLLPNVLLVVHHPVWFRFLSTPFLSVLYLGPKHCVWFKTIMPPPLCTEDGCKVTSRPWSTTSIFYVWIILNRSIFLFPSWLQGEMLLFGKHSSGTKSNTPGTSHPQMPWALLFFQHRMLFQPFTVLRDTPHPQDFTT